MIFDERNPKHIQILREELARAKRIITEEERGTDSWATSTIASQDPLFGRVLYRGATHILKQDERYNALLAAYLRNINKATMEDMTVREMENFLDKLIAFKNKLNPGKEYDPTKSALTPDAYKDGQGRGGWQGD